MRSGLSVLIGVVVAGLTGLAGCSGGAPKGEGRDEQLDAITASAEVAYGRELLPQAAALYGRAVNRARAIDDDRELADAAYNLGLCRIELGDLAGADAALAEARAAADRVKDRGDQIDLARAELRASTGRQHEAYAGATAILERTPSAAGALRMQALALRGLIDAGREQPDRARADLAAAEELVSAAGHEDPGAASRVAQLKARLTTDAGEKAAALDEQAKWLKKAGRTRAMARALGEAGLAHELAGHADEAFDRTRRAVAAFLGVGDAAEALAMIEHSHAGLVMERSEADRAAVQALRAEAMALMQRRGARGQRVGGTR